VTTRHCYVIAEAGSCHDNSPRKMLGLLQEAANAGADAVKFQWTSDPYKMADRRGKAREDGYGEVYAKYLTFMPEVHHLLAMRCRDLSLDYMCTVYLPEDIDVVAPHVARFKVSSFECLDDEFVAAHQGRDKDVLVSLGMASWPELRQSRAWLSCPEGATLLQCTSSYPAPVESLNMAVIDDRIRGFSDHSDPAFTWTGALAFSRGADTIEAHLRLDDTDRKNPDAPHAMKPKQFEEYVRHIRFAEQCMGESLVAVQLVEGNMLRYRV
jgi:N,N'-diacetyllegionaminate synthase